ncbi:unnamed protein product [Moneuplotes crassus]|uniref:Tubulin-tyrosine ligase family protein n=1 Tax=Euplotes crassus TaxID=5936 RepID=A0AAD1XG79_EUPCR|nr:unnamed protein product [Moneuplotes crassus]
MKDLGIDSTLLPEIPQTRKAKGLKKPFGVSSFSSTQEIKSFRNPLKKSQKRVTGHRVTSSQYNIKDDQFYNTSQLDNGFSGIRKTNKPQYVKDGSDQTPLPELNRIDRRYHSKNSKFLKETESASYKKRVSSRKSRENYQTEKEKKYLRDNKSENQHLGSTRSSNYPELNLANEIVLMKNYKDINNDYNFNDASSYNISMKYKFGMRNTLAKSPCSITPKEQSKFHVVDLNKIRLDIKGLPSYKPADVTQRGLCGSLPPSITDRTAHAENRISKEREAIRETLALKVAKNSLNMTADKFAKPQRERSTENLDSMHDMNISGEKYQIKPKYDIEAVDLDKVDLETLLKKEPIQIKTLQKSRSKLKDIKLKPTTKSEYNAVLDFKKKDSRYQEIAKKFKLEKRNHSIPKNEVSSKKVSNEDLLTPKKSKRARLKQKLSFTSTPKYNELKLISKEFSLVKKLKKTNSSSSDDLNPITFKQGKMKFAKQKQMLFKPPSSTAEEDLQNAISQDITVNEAFDLYNQFLNQTFKRKTPLKSSNKDPVKLYISELASCMNIYMPACQINDLLFKNREFSDKIKERMSRFVWSIINKSNNLEIVPQKLSSNGNSNLYGFKVGPGNNSFIIRRLMTEKWWWNVYDKQTGISPNFRWTQWRNNKITKKILTTEEFNEKKAEECIFATENPAMKRVNSTDIQVYNRLENNYHLSNKKALFINMKAYYTSISGDEQHVFKYLPVTFHIKDGLQDTEFGKFTDYYNEQERIREENSLKIKELKEEGKSSEAKKIKKTRNVWIIKPGENTNRGTGIMVSKEMCEIQELCDNKSNKSNKTCIIQKYIEYPLLIHKRKFDIRMFMMITSINGCMKGYFYKDGYLRTSCKEFSLANLSNRMIHLTNDAIQKKDEEYGKYENSNKISYEDFQKYIDTYYSSSNINFKKDILPKAKVIVQDTVKAVFNKIDPKRKQASFEIFGYDFMLDEDFNLSLIEVNTNPCLDQPCPLLARMIPHMLQNALWIGVDPLFPFPDHDGTPKKGLMSDMALQNKFELIFDELQDKKELESLIQQQKFTNEVIVEIDEEGEGELDEMSDEDDY